MRNWISHPASSWDVWGISFSVEKSHRGCSLGNKYCHSRGGRIFRFHWFPLHVFSLGVFCPPIICLSSSFLFGDLLKKVGPVTQLGGWRMGSKRWTRTGRSLGLSKIGGFTWIFIVVLMGCPIFRQTHFLLPKLWLGKSLQCCFCLKFQNLACKAHNRTPKPCVFASFTSAVGSSGQASGTISQCVTIGHEVCLFNPSISPRGIPSWEGRQRCVTRVTRVPVRARWSSSSDGKRWLYGDLDV